MSALLALVALLVATPPTAPSRWVEDHAGFISPATRSALDARLEAYERATGHQVIVWIDKTLGDAALDDWSARTFAAWKIGRKGLDDGVAMFIFADDRAIDIEVGYGLEAKLTDAAASRIIREVMTPKLRAGDRDGAITAGTDAVLAAIEGRPWSGGGVPQPAAPAGPAWWIWGLGALALAILFAVHPRAAMWILWAVMSGFRGGGGGGGFGGGGGRSGGGGARGNW